jgi:hypothetical protein
MLFMLPFSLNATGSARLLSKVEVEVNISVYPTIAGSPDDVPAWVTFTVSGPVPSPETVNVAERGSVLEFSSVAVTVMVPSFDPLVGDTLSQDGIPLILHEVFELILNDPFDPAAEPSGILVGETFKYGLGAPEV